MKKYVIVTWPNSQALMEQDWFDECILINDESHLEKFGPSAYFVPEERTTQILDEDFEDEDVFNTIE